MAQLVTLIPETFFDTTLTRDEQQPAYVCSVYPAQAVITHGAHLIVVPECRDSMDCAISPPIGPGIERKDYGNDQHLVLQSISSYDNAMDAIGLTRPHLNSRGEAIDARTTSDWWESGYFVSKTPKPDPDAVAAARSRLNEWARHWVLKGDDIFGTTQKASQVDFRAKLAARVLRVRRPWAEGITDVQQKTLCPSCKNEINTGATKCPACGDRFVYVDGKPVLKESLELVVPTMPPPQQQPQNQQQKR
jgi:ribosomal protein L37AE/L43A